jgi:hypothetical protein
MNAQDAFHATVHGSPGGCEALAARMGVGAGVLRNKANPNADYHKPTLADADRVMALTGNYSILHALAQNHSHVCIAVEADASASDMAVLEMVTKVWSAGGEVAAEVHVTLADGRVEPHEIARVEASVYRTVQALNAMVARLKGMAEK